MSTFLQAILNDSEVSVKSVEIYNLVTLQDH